MGFPKQYVCLLLVPVWAFSQDRPAQTSRGAVAPVNPEVASALPIKRVVLYKSGVGYFEHLGRVRDDQEVTVPFTSGQLNDVLKSLTVLDLSGGRISGVEYGSAAPVDRQLGDLRLAWSEKSSLTELLSALRGARLEVRSGANVISGRLLSVERKTRIAGGVTLEVDYLSLMSDNGELRTTELSPAFSVRLLERGLAAKMGRFLDIASAAREADVRRMVISTAGAGERSLFVSYISEVPVWKSTYRIVLSPKAKPLLQGWAIVDNTVGEDWDKVELSLVAGAPHSFIQNLSQPYFARRPVVALPDSMLVSPQTYQATLIAGAGLYGIVTDSSGAVIEDASVKAYGANGALAGEARTDAAGEYQFPSLPDGMVRLEISKQGFTPLRIANVNVAASKSVQQDATLQVGSMNQAVTVTAAASNLQTSRSDLPLSGRNFENLATTAPGRSGRRASSTTSSGSNSQAISPSIETARASTEASAHAQELGDLFEYKLKEPITIGKNRSALVPIVQSSIAAEKVSVWNERAGLARPQRALWITNTSGLTLDGGSFSVLEDETFAGEGIFEPIRPGEKRLVSYATDLAINASSRHGDDRQRVSRVRIERGVMKQEREILEKRTYTFRNEDTAPRTVIVEHPVRSGYELRSEAQPVESTSDWKRFRLALDAKQTASLTVDEARIEQVTYALTNITDDQVALFVKEQSINKTIEDTLRRILAQKAAVAELDNQKSAREEERDEIFNDQQRLRENMKSLRGSAEEKKLLERYTDQLNARETRLAALRKESQDIDAQRDKAQTVLDRMLEELSLDVKL